MLVPSEPTVNGCGLYEEEEEPAVNGCGLYEEEESAAGPGLYENVSDEYAGLCSMFPGRLFQIGLLLKLLTGVRMSCTKQI